MKRLSKGANTRKELSSRFSFHWRRINNDHYLPAENNSSKRNNVRSYNRSRVPRLRWTNDLHHCFVNVVQQLGGQDRATPKMILPMMNVKGLTISHIKSHLQMYRSMKSDEMDMKTTNHLILKQEPSAMKNSAVLMKKEFAAAFFSNNEEAHGDRTVERFATSHQLSSSPHVVDIELTLGGTYHAS